MKKAFRRSHGRAVVKRWGVAKLHGKESTGEKLMKEEDKAASVEEKWDTLKSALYETVEEVFSHEQRKQPDWFREGEVDLKPLVEERNRLYALWLATGSERTERDMLLLKG